MKFKAEDLVQFKNIKGIFQIKILGIQDSSTYKGRFGMGFGSMEGLESNVYAPTIDSLYEIASNEKKINHKLTKIFGD